MHPAFHYSDEVAEALSTRRPIVALESTVIAHGLPHPQNLETAQRLQALVRGGGAVPATIAVLGGEIRVGLGPEELERLATSRGIAKLSARDIAPVAAHGGSGATTVAGTLAVAKAAGLRVFATGGIGGVHRGGETSLDISADLKALGNCPVAVVSAGAKSILDLPRTLEMLESEGVPVIGFGTGVFPAFHCRSSGLNLEHRVGDAAAAAGAMQAHWSLGQPSGLLIANPVPQADALPDSDVAAWIDTALAEADDAGIAGKEVTPYLLKRLEALSGGRTLKANIALLENNARVAAEIAVAYGVLQRGVCGPA